MESLRSAKLVTFYVYMIEIYGLEKRYINLFYLKGLLGSVILGFIVVRVEVIICSV